MQAWLLESHMMTGEKLAAIEAEVDAEVEAAAAFAESGTWEDLADLERFVRMDEVPL
jgi:TPP-dependent pyruvate/acetoin dehydrogenase alpha subunit